MLTITFDDVCADPTVVETLRNMVSLPLLFPEQFEYGILARQGLGGILLYGPPGTGKTTLCRALAYECGAQMLILKPSDIFNMWAGESEKLASAIFVSKEVFSPVLFCLTMFLSEYRVLRGVYRPALSSSTRLIRYLESGQMIQIGVTILWELTHLIRCATNLAIIGYRISARNGRLLFGNYE
jgi:hypothetical protein